MQEMSGSSVVARSEGWLSAWVGEELVMMSAETGTCISLSETGGRTWDLLEQPQTLDALCNQLAEEYDASATDVRADVLVFLTKLREEGGVTLSTPAAE